jgi:hypothetical protein
MSSKSEIESSTAAGRAAGRIILCWPVSETYLSHIANLANRRSAAVAPSGGRIEFDQSCEARWGGDRQSFLAHTLKMKLEGFLDEALYLGS